VHRNGPLWPALHSCVRLPRRGLARPRLLLHSFRGAGALPAYFPGTRRCALALAYCVGLPRRSLARPRFVCWIARPGGRGSNAILVPMPKQPTPNGTPGKKPPAGLACPPCCGAAVVAKALGIVRVSLYRSWRPEARRRFNPRGGQLNRCFPEFCDHVYPTAASRAISRSGIALQPAKHHAGG